MFSSEVMFATDGAVTFLTFNRPDAHNAMTWAMYDALAAACDRVDADENIRVFVLRATGEAFVAGTDIRQFAEFVLAHDGEWHRECVRNATRDILRIAAPRQTASDQR